PIEGDSYYTVDPVMYLYKIDDPHNYTYYNDDASGLGHHAQITATLPAGEYYLVIRAYSSYYASTTTGRQGLVNVFQDGYILNSQCPIAGYSVDVDSPNTGIINYFT
ncbi:DVUA0089 family protein, partial [Tannerella forsythia]